jgi:hypothetical protein
MLKTQSRGSQRRITAMADNTQVTDGAQSRNYLAYAILGFSVLAITVLAWKAIDVDGKNALTILNIVLPVVSSWVGTILAFYFGKENFESANLQVRELIRKLTPEERAESLVADVMRRFSDTAHVKIPEGKSDGDIKIKDLRAKFDGAVSRLPIVNSNDSPRYILHKSSIDRYLISGGTEEDTLAKFIDNQKAVGFEFGLNKGFIVVSETTTVATAKGRLEQVPSCQDIFITKGGTEKEPLSGWISNVRLTKFLQG